jgi:signal transduction histidine kinase
MQQRALPGELIVVLSHELRQPLTSIKGFTEMLLAHWADFSDSDKRTMLEEVLHDAERVGRLVDDLLEGSRLESGQLCLRRRPTDLAELVARVVSNFGPSYPGLEASVELGSPLPAVVVDPYKLEQVLANIVENACKHGSAGTVRITGRVTGGPDGGRGEGGEGEGGKGEGLPGREVEIAVADAGKGIPAEDLPHVTEKFYRSSATEPSGLGLGLWISKGIVEAHGGKLAVTSGPVGGTTVRFSIPLQGNPGSGKLAGS